VNLPVSDASMFARDSSTFAKEFRERFSTLKTEFDEVCTLCVHILGMYFLHYEKCLPGILLVSLMAWCSG